MKLQYQLSGTQSGTEKEIRTEQIVTQLGLTETTAKRYLRQLTEFGYLEAHGGNRNKSYTRKWKNKMFYSYRTELGKKTTNNI